MQEVIQQDEYYSAFTYLCFIKKLCQHPLLLQKVDKEKKSAPTHSQPSFEDSVQPENPPKEDLIQVLDLGELMNPVLEDHKKARYKELVSRSSKFQFLFDLLHMLKAQGCRPLVFSHSKVLLNILEEIILSDDHLAKEFTYFRIDGDVEIDIRDDLCKQFNRDTSIFMGILTTGVAGYGLNLVGADRVVIFDPDWNPATDNQAVDRIYRIGQKKDVMVY